MCATGPAFFCAPASLLAVLPREASLADFSAAGVFAPVTTLPKSRLPPATPGVFGVLDGAPKDANAPEPRPKALDAPTVGDGMAGDASGMELNGLDFPP